MKLQTVLTAASVLALAACAPKPTLSFGFNLASSGAGLTSQQKSKSAEELALAAEQLAQSASFSYAARLSREALKIDPTNVRAKFWNAAVAPVMELKGLMTRIEPLAQRTHPREYAQAKQRMKKVMAIKSVSDFIFDGPKDITSEDEIQDTISRVTMRLNDFRKTLKSLRGEELVIHLNPASVSTSDQYAEAYRSCTAKETSPGQITLEGCDLSGAYQVRLNSADFEILQQGVAMYQVYIGMMNSYSAKGALSLPADEMTPEMLFKNPQFGKLRDGRVIRVLPELALDATLAARDAYALHKKLCTTNSDWSRPGHLIGQGSCALPHDGTLAAIKTIALLAKGPAAIALPNNQSITVDLKAFSQHPVTDLRSVQQLDRAAKDRTQPTDETVGGLFPNRDIEKLFAN